MNKPDVVDAPNRPVAPAVVHDKQRLAFLDALRGLAAVYVLVYHTLLLPQPNLVPPRWAAMVALNGGMGVTLFFLVSAFSLYYTMPLRLREWNPTASFYLHRFFRIAPLFYVVLAATLVRDVVVFGASHSVAEVAASLAFVFNLIPTWEQGIVWVSWTIGVEMLFYAVFPLLYARITSVASSITLVFGMLLLWLATKVLLDYLVIPDAWKQSILQWNVLKHMPIFAIGIATYHVFLRLFPKGDPAPSVPLGNALLLGGLFGFTALLQGWLPNIFGDTYYWQGIWFAVLFLGIALSPWRVFVNAVTCYLGRVSYSIYLLHTTIIYFLTPVYHAIYRNVPTLTLAFLCSVTLTLALVVALSELTFRLVESPGMRLGKTVQARFRRRAAERVGA